MICIILTSPDGAKTIGLSTDDQSTVTVVSGVSCYPGFIASVSELSHRADISRATGCLPEPIQWGFELIDWDGLLRRSVGILDGTTQLVGWSADLYVDSTVVLSAGAFEVIGAVANGTTISVSCREKWIGNAQTVGIGTGETRVPLVVGGAPVSVKTMALETPIPIAFGGFTGWRSGNPEADYDATIKVETKSTRKAIDGSSPTFFFRCADAAEASRLNNLASSGILIASGGDYVEPVGIFAYGNNGGSYEFSVVVSQEMYDWTGETEVELYTTATTAAAVVGGADSVIGFIDDNGIAVLPQGAASVGSDFVLSFSPAGATADGFRAYTVIPSRVAFDPAFTPGSSEITLDGFGVPGAGVVYLGSTDNIATDETAEPSFDALDTYLAPVSSTNSFTIFSRFDLSSGNNEMRIPLRIAPLADPGKYSRYSLEVKARLSMRADADSLATTTVAGKDPYTSEAEWTRYLPSHQAVESWTRTANVPVMYKRDQAFADIDDINALPDTYLSSSDNNGLFANLQLCAVRLYGVSNIKFGSSYAVVQPGESPWWASPRQPAQAASDLLDAIDGSMAASNPTYVVQAANWGRSFDQDTTFYDAAKELANEFWFVLGRGSNGVSAGAAGEIPGAPGITLGDRNDVVTEIVIEYDEWNGEFRRTAYVAHVDETFDSSNPSRYFGGWDDEGADTGYGLSIWNACRKAWQIHGVKASQTIQAPSISTPSVLGLLWTSKRNNVSRIQWIALQSRYLSLRIAEPIPTWWAGNTVKIPLAALDWAGYDLSEFAGVNLICTEKTWDPVTLTTSFEVALPPVTGISTQKRIVQTADATDRIIQTADATKRYIQVGE